MDVAILSPHLDDAVLSCWSVLSGPGRVLVVNVFTGAPAAGSGARWWDRLTGAGDSAQRMRERIDEDRRALALAGRSAVNLGLLEAQYRDDGSVPGLVAPLAESLDGGCLLYVPAAMGEHPDHALVRDAALALRRNGAQVILYADLPHAIARGWPSWVAGAAGFPDVDDEWERALRAVGVDAAAADAMVCTLERDRLATKVEALRAYVTQFAALDALAFRPLLNPGTLRYEVFWPLG
jgi:LmbE family N-acetylglucosaminyl deacetylase